MIKQIIFDVGNVLLDFDPAAMISAVTSHPRKAAVLRREIFSHSDWSRLDRGEGEETVLPSIKARLPGELHPLADRLMAHWHESLTPIEETFFIDDSPLNVESAQWCGLTAFQFRRDMGELRTALRARGVPVEP